MKVCFKCKQEKPLDEFYKHKKMADGHLNKCKECVRTDVRKNRLENIEYYRAYDAARSGLQNRVEARLAYSKTDRGKEAGSRAKSNWSRRNPIKRMAATIIGNAVRDGKILKGESCESCGSVPSIIHGHHDDYAFPLIVRWLCPGCHSKWHKENGEGKNAT